jgi:hypothetical protein
MSKHRVGRWRRSALYGIAGAGPALSVACRDASGVISDNWGPPAGYALVTGTVRTTAGAPVTGTEVALTRCAEPVEGFLGSASTDARGAYQLRGQLPPVGVLSVKADTLRIRCYAFLNRASVPSDSLDVRFSADAQTPAVQVLNFTTP